jgi:hypothetical protein
METGRLGEEENKFKIEMVKNLRKSAESAGNNKTRTNRKFHGKG